MPFKMRYYKKAHTFWNSFNTFVPESKDNIGSRGWKMASCLNYFLFIYVYGLHTYWILNIFLLILIIMERVAIDYRSIYIINIANLQNNHALCCFLRNYLQNRKKSKYKSNQLFTYLSQTYDTFFYMCT